MFKQKLKIVSTILATFLLIFVFSGCNKKPENQNKQIDLNSSPETSQNQNSDNDQTSLNEEDSDNSGNSSHSEEDFKILSQETETQESFITRTIQALENKIWNDEPKSRKALTTDDIDIKNESIKRHHIKDDAIDSSKIDNRTIEEKDLNDNAISDLRLILDDFITTDKIKNLTLTNADIAEDAQIASSKLDLSDYSMINLPTDDEKFKLGELIDTSDSNITLGNKNISNIHQQNTDTSTTSNTFTIGDTTSDLALYFGQASRSLTYNNSSSRFELNLPLHLSSEKITGLATPTEDTDAATKAYVDNQLSTEINNLKWKDPVDTLGNLPACDSGDDGEARLVEDENWIYRCDGSDDTWYKVANVGTVNHSALQNRDASDSHPASAIGFTSAGSLSSTDLQNALEEIDNETLKFSPTSSQTITYQDPTATTIIKMDNSQSASPFKITTSTDTDIFNIGTTGLITTASINSASIVNNSITDDDLATDINLTTTGNLQANALTLTTSGMPISITSTTKITNLNADLLDGFNTSQTGGSSIVPATDASGNLTLTNAKLNFETLQLEAETTEPTQEEGKIYYNDNEKTYKLYNAQENTYIDLVADPKIQPTKCPDGFVPVPGDVRYGTAGGFCVMKYEAKCAETATPTTGLTTPDTGYQTYANNTTACTSANDRQVASLPDGYPIANISQIDAKTYCESMGDDYHLITNNEWMTIARNIEQQDSNWTSGTVGTDGIWRGHTDNDPANALEANSDDSFPYEGTNNSGPSSIEKRTFTLSNGEVIWDLSGNVWEWNQDTIQANQAPIDSDPISEWIEFTAIADYQMMSYANTRPSNPDWNSSQNMGRFYTDYDDGTAERAFRRGGHWSAGSYAGLFTAILSYSPTSSLDSLGFRCVR
jgi:formylglycine-generating enzyme required for sulfatase activity